MWVDGKDRDSYVWSILLTRVLVVRICVCMNSPASCDGNMFPGARAENAIPEYRRRNGHAVNSNGAKAQYL